MCSGADGEIDFNVPDDGLVLGMAFNDAGTHNWFLGCGFIGLSSPTSQSKFGVRPVDPNIANLEMNSHSSLIMYDFSPCSVMANLYSHQGDIYTNAQVTIVASSRNLLSYGLPGVGCIPHRPQRVERVGKAILLESYEHPANELSESPWATRVGTLQESLLSPRRVIFSETQVTYLCNTTHWVESWEAPGLNIDQRTMDSEADASQTSVFGLVLHCKTELLNGKRYAFLSLLILVKDQDIYRRVGLLRYSLHSLIRPHSASHILPEVAFTNSSGELLDELDWPMHIGPGAEFSTVVGTLGPLEAFWGENPSDNEEAFR
ncbi:hypothetical protein BJ166DRAFT_492263 [Pestalotiopsis sp. NC0098]|nr:hypothetical protein BJ166DRAFT_492263 [Pestalotiopsis sp. NC0098]